MRSRFLFAAFVSLLIAGLGWGISARGDGSGASAASRPSPAQVEQYTGRSAFMRKLFDQDTQLNRWTAPDLPGISADRVGPVAAAIRKDYKLTGETRPPVVAARLAPDAPAVQLDLGHLEIGCYVIRVIALVKSEDIEQHRKPLYLDFRVNDRPGGAASYYRHRIPYWDDFFCVTEFYFNADESRAYRGTLAVGPGSMVDLHVHAIEFHDVLRGLDGRAHKTRPGLFTDEERAVLRQQVKPEEVRAKVKGQVLALDSYLADPASPELDAGGRRQRDEVLWNAFPPINSQFLGWFPLAFQQKEVYSPPSLNMAEVEAQHGRWELEGSWKNWFGPLVIVNNKLGLRYTREDLENHRPLPDPYPYKDDGGAVYLPRKEGMEHAEHFSPLGLPLRYRWTAMANPVAITDGDDAEHRLPYLYHVLGDRRAARDAALLLCKWAYIFPTFTQAQVLDGSLIAPATPYNYDPRLVRRFANGEINGIQQGLAVSYDFLFDFIQGNQELAHAVSRFIPWVKTEGDVRRLIETRVLQFGAKQVMRFHVRSDKETPGLLMRLAAVQQDPDLTRPWMEYLWKETWVYPHARAGLPDYLSTTTQRDGSTDIGSIFYTGAGSPFLPLSLMTRRYVRNGGDPKYDLTDLDRYRKIRDACTLPLAASVAGYPLSIGDVGGPAKPRIFSGLAGFELNFRAGAHLASDAALAWITREYFGRAGESDAQWADLVAAAARQPTNPFLGQPSRVLANWAGILETGQEAQDFRFVRAAILRVGTGHGHQHSDTLDLQVIAHGVRAANDVGWRPGYSAPHPTFSQLHNLVEVDETNWQGHAWVPILASTPGIQYMMGVASPPASVKTVRSRTREVALVDVDEGTPGTQPPAPLPYTDQTRFDPQAITPNSYVFDVERIAGGSMHTYCFHGTISDEFHVNAAAMGEPQAGAEADYLRRFLQGGDCPRQAGTAPESLEATWRLRRSEQTVNTLDRDGKPVAIKIAAGEAAMLGPAYDPASRPKFTRLHLPGQAGARVLTAWLMPTDHNPERATWPFLFVQKRGEDLQTVWPAIIEPYAGEPFITGVRRLPMADNEDDAMQAVAVEVTTRNGRVDLCFSDGRLKPRSVAAFEIAGRYAYVSRDDQGLRLAQLVEGTRLATPWGTLLVDKPAHAGTIVRVDYFKRSVWLDGEWSNVELVGQQVELGNPKHRTSFTVVAAEREGELTRLTLDKALDLSFAHVVSASPQTGKVVVNIGPVGLDNGMNEGLTCTTDDLARSWRCRVLGGESGNFAYQLEGAFSESDFPVGSVLRLWELGVGDEARLASHATVRRTSGQGWEITSNCKAQFVPAK
jgi:hypothetical protein